MNIDSNKRKIKAKPDYSFIIASGVLFLIGIITLLSASAPKALAESGNSYYYFTRQLFFGVIGIIGAIVVYNIDYRKYNKKQILIFLYILMVVVSIMVRFIGKETKGAVRWIKVGPIQIQPSEFVKVGMLFVTAGFCFYVHKNGKLKEANNSIIPLLLILIMAGVTFITQNHMSAAILIAIAGIAQILIAGVNYTSLITSGLAILAVGGTAAYSVLSSGSGGFRGQRIEVWKNPFDYIKGAGWQIVQSLYAVGSGGLFGEGLGDSKQKQSYIPEPQNDFIFSIFSEEWGFIGVVIVIAIFIFLIWRGVLIARNAPDFFGKILAIGIISMFSCQVIINLAVVSNLIPVTGMPLPFFSYGGTALVVLLLQIGLMANISKESDRSIKEKEIKKKYLNC